MCAIAVAKYELAGERIAFKELVALERQLVFLGIEPN